eukprot:TRINITY_DN4640_c0_g1_i1.p1 TRINITY_DN4640_c0_g1~~TRINITY_DN4640_c0_g1_i1.p1  ORF type:complete len:392 (+),score=43.23 TRINITY_DN4640_c0_g1_i1:70-1245(+)
MSASSVDTRPSSSFHSLLRTTPCPYCNSSLDSSFPITILFCGHLHHVECVKTLSKSQGQKLCVVCGSLEPSKRIEKSSLDLESKDCEMCGVPSQQSFSSQKVILPVCDHSFHVDCLHRFCVNEGRIFCPHCSQTTQQKWQLSPTKKQNYQPPHILQLFNKTSHISQTTTTTTTTITSTTNTTQTNIDIHNDNDNTEEKRLLESMVKDKEETLRVRLLKIWRLYWEAWHFAWRYGATGEIRGLRVVSSAILTLTTLLLIISPYARRNYSIITYLMTLFSCLAEAILTMWFCPGALLIVPAAWSSLLFSYRIIASGLFSVTWAELVLEPLLAFNLLFMNVYWITKNVVIVEETSESCWWSRAYRIRAPEEIYLKERLGIREQYAQSSEGDSRL